MSAFLHAFAERLTLMLAVPAVALVVKGLSPVLLLSYGVELLADYAEPLGRGGDEP